MTKKGERRADVLISGGGIAGLTLAALLGKAGLNIDVIEPAPPAPLFKTPLTARTVALMESSLNIVRATDVWPKIAREATALQTMRIIDDSMPGEKKIEAAFSAKDIGLEQFGFNVPNNKLRAALYELVKKIPSVKFHESPLQDYEVGDSVTATLKDGTEIKSSLIVGADGRNSRVRQVAGIEVNEKDYGQSAITCLISHTREHNNTSTEFHRPGGPFALVPLPGRKSAVVWVEWQERADEIIKLRKNEFLNVLQKNSKDVLGTLNLESNPESWPLKSLKAKEITAPRMALIAEAAHVMSPITAQGLNLSLRDVAALAETIMDSARAGIDIGAESVLSKYRRRRLSDINTRVMGVNGMNSLVSADFAFIKGMRRRGLKAVDFIPPVRKFAMRQGLAPDIDKGRLAKGEAL